MTFFLQFGRTDSSVWLHAKGLATTLPERRAFLDDRKHDAADITREIEAPTWLAARAQISDWDTY